MEQFPMESDFIPGYYEEVVGCTQNSNSHDDAPVVKASVENSNQTAGDPEHESSNENDYTSIASSTSTTSCSTTSGSSYSSGHSSRSGNEYEQSEQTPEQRPANFKLVLKKTLSDQSIKHMADDFPTKKPNELFELKVISQPVVSQPFLHKIAKASAANARALVPQTTPGKDTTVTTTLPVKAMEQLQSKISATEIPTTFINNPNFNQIPDAKSQSEKVSERESAEMQTKNNSPAKMQREFKSLQQHVNESKILTEFLDDNASKKPRKSRTLPLKSGSPTASKMKRCYRSTSFSKARVKEMEMASGMKSSSTKMRSRSKSVHRQSFDSNNSMSGWPSDDKISKRQNMRSQNTDFVQKQKNFLNRVQAEVENSDNSDEEASLNDSFSKSEHKKALQPPPKLGWDAFCWKCHSGGDLIPCSKCVKSWHLKCLKIHVIPNKLENWLCPECVGIENSIKSFSKTGKYKFSLDNLSQLLQFALKRMKLINGSDHFFTLLDAEDNPDFGKYIVYPLSITIMQQRIEKNYYKSTEEFAVEAKWLHHNAAILHSSHNKLTTLAKTLAKICRQEVNEIETCAECYFNANTRRDWFVEVCSKPHILLWAKLKGFPYWPAKAMGVIGNSMVDVRFFGDHDRANVPIKDCYLYCKNDPNPQTKQNKRNNIMDSVKEVDTHIAKIESRIGAFNHAPFRTPYEPSNELMQLELMIPGVTRYMEKLSKNPKPALTLKIIKSADNHLSIVKKAEVAANGDANTSKIMKTDERKSPKKKHITGDDLEAHTDSNTMDVDASVETPKSTKAARGVVVGTIQIKPHEPLFGPTQNPNKSGSSAPISSTSTTNTYEVVTIKKPGSESENDPARVTSVILKRKCDDNWNAVQLNVPKKHKTDEDMKNDVSSKKTLGTEIMPKDENQDVNKNEEQIKVVEGKSYSLTLQPNRSLRNSNSIPKKTDEISKDTNKEQSVKLSNKDNILNEKLQLNSSFSNKEVNEPPGNLRARTISENEKQIDDKSVKITSKQQSILRKVVKRTEMSSINNIPGSETSSTISLNNSIASSNGSVISLSSSTSISPDPFPARTEATCAGNSTGMSTVTLSASDSSSLHQERKTSQTTTQAKNVAKSTLLPPPLRITPHGSAATEEKPVTQIERRVERILGLIPFEEIKTEKPDEEECQESSATAMDSSSQNNDVSLDTSVDRSEAIMSSHTSVIKSEINSDEDSERADLLKGIFPVAIATSKSQRTAASLINRSEISVKKISVKDITQLRTASINKKLDQAEKKRAAGKPRQNPRARKTFAKALSNSAKAIFISAGNSISTAGGGKQPLQSKPVLQGPAPNLAAIHHTSVTRTPKISCATKNVNNMVYIPVDITITGNSKPVPVPPLTAVSKVSVGQIGSTTINHTTTSNLTTTQPTSGFVVNALQGTRSFGVAVDNVMPPQQQTANVHASVPPLIATSSDGSNGNSNNPSTSTSTDRDHMLAGFITPNLASAITDTLSRTRPKLIPKPSGILQSEGDHVYPSSAGPISKALIDNAHKMTDFFRSVIEDTLVNLVDSGSLEAKVKLLELELEIVKQKHDSEIADLKHNTDIMLCEMKNSLETEKSRLVAETRKTCEQERIRSVEETKKKQWCTNCGKEAQFYCCWNTSYCGYTCQEKHWGRHQSGCAQNDNNSDSAAANINRSGLKIALVKEKASTVSQTQQKRQKETASPRTPANSMLRPTMPQQSGPTPLPLQRLIPIPTISAPPRYTLINRSDCSWQIVNSTPPSSNQLFQQTSAGLILSDQTPGKVGIAQIPTSQGIIDPKRKNQF